MVGLQVLVLAIGVRIPVLEQESLQTLTGRVHYARLQLIRR